MLLGCQMFRETLLRNVVLFQAWIRSWITKKCWKSGQKWHKNSATFIKYHSISIYYYSSNNLKIMSTLYFVGIRFCRQFDGILHIFIVNSMHSLRERSKLLHWGLSIRIVWIPRPPLKWFAIQTNFIRTRLPTLFGYRGASVSKLF